MASRLAQGSLVPGSDRAEPRVSQHLTRRRAIFWILGEQASDKILALWRYVPDSSALVRRYYMEQGVGGGGNGPTSRCCEEGENVSLNNG